MRRETIETDVLILGSGATGERAALEASAYGVRVHVVDKNLFGRSGATAVAIAEKLVREHKLSGDPFKVSEPLQKVVKTTTNPDLAKRADAVLKQLPRK